MLLPEFVPKPSSLAHVLAGSLARICWHTLFGNNAGVFFSTKVGMFLGTMNCHRFLAPRNPVVSCGSISITLLCACQAALLGAR